MAISYKNVAKLKRLYQSETSKWNHQFNIKFYITAFICISSHLQFSNSQLTLLSATFRPCWLLSHVLHLIYSHLIEDWKPLRAAARPQFPHLFSTFSVAHNWWVLCENLHFHALCYLHPPVIWELLKYCYNCYVYATTHFILFPLFICFADQSTSQSAVVLSETIYK